LLKKDKKAKQDVGLVVVGVPRQILTLSHIIVNIISRLNKQEMIIKNGLLMKIIFISSPLFL